WAGVLLSYSGLVWILQASIIGQSFCLPNVGYACFPINHGNVGIGTTEPGEKLHTFVSSGDVANKIETANSANWAGVHLRSSGQDWILQASQTEQRFRITNEENEWFTIKTGNVGIGTIDPQSQLDIGANVASTAVQARIGRNDADNYLGLSQRGVTVQRIADSTVPFEIRTSNSGSWGAGGGHIDFLPDDTQAMRIDVNGNVGIGTTSPGAKLEVFDGALRLSKSNASLYHMDIKPVDLGDANIRYDFIVKDFSGLQDVAALSINGQTGNVGIGTTTPNSKLAVVGLSIYANNAAAIAGGLAVGDFYRTGGDPDLVCVVH
ncbi:MAG: hypothetical protein ABIH08_04760, partial [Candidatus Omnitrophota bacterium]